MAMREFSPTGRVHFLEEEARLRSGDSGALLDALDTCSAASCFISGAHVVRKARFVCWHPCLSWLLCGGRQTHTAFENIVSQLRNNGRARPNLRAE